MAGQGALVAAARRGGRAAFAELVGRHRPLLAALCRRALGGPELAEDAVQEAVLLAMTGLDRLRRVDRFGSWLAGIGLNVCRRWSRERSRESWSWEAVQGGRADDLPAAGPGPAELAEAAELAARVRRAVAGLPAGQRAAVALYYLAGLSQAEVAACTGTSVAAVKTRLHKMEREVDAYPDGAGEIVAEAKAEWARAMAALETSRGSGQPGPRGGGSGQPGPGGGAAGACPAQDAGPGEPAGPS